MSCLQSNRALDQLWILLLAPDFCITAPSPSLLGTIKAHGIRDRLVLQHWASWGALQQLQLSPDPVVSLSFSRRT